MNENNQTPTTSTGPSVEDFYQMMIDAFHNDKQQPLSDALARATLQDRENFIEAANRFQADFGSVMESDETESDEE